MGAYSTLGKNLMLDALKGTAPATPITHVALFDRGTPFNVTGETSDDNVDATSHGLANGNLIHFTAKNGGTNIRLNYPYFVISSAANLFQISETPGGSVVDFGSDLIATTTVVRLAEITGGSPAYARKAITFNAAAGGVMDDSTNGAVFDVPAAATVDDVGFYSAITAGTLLAVDQVTSESFGAQGTYTVTDADLDLNA